jgi:hypothetical protein
MGGFETRPYNLFFKNGSSDPSGLIIRTAGDQRPWIPAFAGMTGK